jgi:aspartyl aminopeptidase
VPDAASIDPVDDLIAYLDESPSPWHAVATSARRLLAAGFQPVALDAPWGQQRAGFTVRDGALVAWRVPEAAPAWLPFRIVGAHTDSPNLRVKPRPDSSLLGWKQLGVEVYGGILNNSWLDRDLGIAGRVIAGGNAVPVLVRRGVARVAQLAVHLDRDVNDRGLVLDKQAHLTPIWGSGAGRAGDFQDWLAAEVGIESSTIETWDLCLFDIQGAARLGGDASLLASGRIDNQVSCWAATTALIDAPEPTAAAQVIVLFDHEEVGSSSTTGAAGPLLEAVLERLVLARGGGRADLLQAFAGSICISADGAHAVHPNYPERHEPGHRPIVNEGPAIKINANQRYATSSETAAFFQRACTIAGVPHQVFVSRNNMPCGSTIGPITATRLGIDTVDVGVPQLSMHSARELCGTADPPALAAALHVVFTT